MRFCAAVVAASSMAVLGAASSGCGEPTACEDAVVALCTRAIECSGKGTAAFVKGDASAFSVVDYGNQESCENQLVELCPQNDTTAAAEPFPQCKIDAATATCSELKDAPGTRVPVNCESIVKFLEK